MLWSDRPFGLFAVGVNRIHCHLVLLSQQRHAGLELQLRFGQVETLAIHRDIIAVGARNQSVLEPDMHGLRAAARFYPADGGFPLWLRNQPHGPRGTRVDVWPVRGPK